MLTFGMSRPRARNASSPVGCRLPKRVGFVAEITSVFIESHVVKLGGREAAVQRETRRGATRFSLSAPQERLGW